MKSLRIKTKVSLSFMVAVAAAILIGLSGYINMDRMYKIVSDSELMVTQPLSYLNRITFDIGQISSLVRDTLIENSAGQDTIIQELDEYQERIREDINAYLDLMYENGLTDSSEYAVLSELSVLVSEWAIEMGRVASMSASGQVEAATEALYGPLISKATAVNSLLEELVKVYEVQAAENREAAIDSFTTSTVFFIAMISILCIAMIILGMIIARSINRSVTHITTAAKSLARGNTHIDISGLPDDEMGQVGNALKSVATSIAGMIAENYIVFLNAGAGFLNSKANADAYEGDYRKMLRGVNMTLQTFCSHLDVMPVAISFFDPSCSFVYGNKAMSELLPRIGVNEDDDGLLAYILTSGASKDIPDDALKVLSDIKTQTWSTTVELVSEKHDDAYTFALSLHRVDDIEKEEGGGLSCLLLTMVDVSEIASAKSEAEFASRAKTDFLSNMSHEIRTPMNVIVGMAQIARRTNDIDKKQDCIDKIEASSHHLLALINDVLDMSKIEAGKLVLAEERVDLNDTFTYVDTMMRQKMRESGIDFVMDKDISHSVVVSDNLRLNQVLINLLSNALKFSPDGGQIRLSVKETDSDPDRSTYLFSVSDQGIGMNEEQKERLFKAFEQADVSITKRYGGTGLGLSISKNIVGLMDGKIWADSEPGKGSTFYFTVRLSTLEDDGTEAVDRSDRFILPGDAPFDFSTLRALVVDDIEINRAIVSEMFSETGIMIEEAENGIEAVKMFRDSEPGHYDIILMDMQMPEMDGCEATRKIRDEDRPDAKTVPIVAMTANALVSDIENALDSGMNGHVAKPINFDEMSLTIRYMCSVKLDISQINPFK